MVAALAERGVGYCVLISETLLGAFVSTPGPIMLAPFPELGKNRLWVLPHNLETMR